MGKGIWGGGGDGAHSIQQTRDGGYIVAGETLSLGLDIYIIKLKENYNKN